jgi:hypothetical protein
MQVKTDMRKGAEESGQNSGKPVAFAKFPANSSLQGKHGVPCLIEGTFVLVYIPVPVCKMPYAILAFYVAAFYFHDVYASMGYQDKKVYLSIQTFSML